MLYTMILRNTKLFFKDKGMFFTALITPLVLLVLYVTFLGSVYADSFRSSIPEGIAVSDTIVNSMVAGELLSSLLAVCCITVAFCANMRMVQDKITGAQKDIAISPAKSHLISISYFISSALVTWIICFIALLAGLIYVHAVGYDMALSDVAWMILDIVMLVLFGTSSPPFATVSSPHRDRFPQWEPLSAPDTALCAVLTCRFPASATPSKKSCCFFPALMAPPSFETTPCTVSLRNWKRSSFRRNSLRAFGRQWTAGSCSLSGKCRFP